MESLGFADSKKEMEVVEVSATTNSPLVRLVTMETTAESSSPHHQAVESLPTIMDSAESPHPAAPRLSNEHHVGGHDLVLHLHGLSPNPSGGPPRLPMRRLSRPSASRPNVLRTSNIPFDEDDCLDTYVNFVGVSLRGNDKCTCSLLFFCSLQPICQTCGTVLGIGITCRPRLGTFDKVHR